MKASYKIKEIVVPPPAFPVITIDFSPNQQPV